MAKKESPDKDTDTTTDTKAAANESVLDAETVNARAKNVSVDPSDAIKKASDRIQKAKQDLAAAEADHAAALVVVQWEVPAFDVNKPTILTEDGRVLDAPERTDPRARLVYLADGRTFEHVADHQPTGRWVYREVKR